VTLTFDLLTLESMHAKRLPCTAGLRLPPLVMLARAVFILELEHTQTYTQFTDATPTARLYGRCG